jgi:hypothetical protein
MINVNKFIDPRLGAVPTIRIADEERLTDSIDRAAALIGKDVFYLKVGELLYNKGGMISDGAIAGRRVDEAVPTRDEKHKRVINPMVGELVSMMGQVEEFKEIRDEVRKIEAIENVAPKERKQTDKEVKEFLDKPEVKQDWENLKKSESKTHQATQKMAQLEADHPELVADPTRIAVLQSSLRDQPTDLSVLSEYVTAKHEQSSAARASFEYASSLREKAERFAIDHPQFAKYAGVVLQGIGNAAMAGAMITAASAGLPALAATGGMIWASNEAMAAVIENGTEALVEYAASQGQTQAEAERFARTAVWAVESVATGAAILGITKLLQNKATVASKVSTLKADVVSIAKRTFERTQRAPQRIDTTSLESIARTVADSPTIAIKRELYRGGAYADIKKAPKLEGIEAHHIPPKSISGISERAGSAIQMDLSDHAKTSSYRYSKKSIAYREMLEQKIESGDVRGAYATDIWDVKRGSKTKYNEAMRQMLEYGKSEGIIPPKK